jgi:hypothetical protein
MAKTASSTEATCRYHCQQSGRGMCNHHDQTLHCYSLPHSPRQSLDHMKTLESPEILMAILHLAKRLAESFDTVYE